MALAWMELAWKQEGQKEIPGSAANPEIIAYFHDAGYPNVHSDEVPWCAAFACACLERAGIRSPRTLAARDFLNFGTPIDTPRLGAIAVFSRPPDPQAGHVGFVAGETADCIVVLGGNQADSVCLAHFPKSRLIGLRWPGEMLTPADLKEQGSRTIAAADSSIRSQVIGGAFSTAVVAGAASSAGTQGATLSQVARQASEYKGAVLTIMDFIQFISHSWMVLAAIVAAWFGGKALYHAYQVKRFRTEDANTGAHQGPGAINASAANSSVALIR